MFRKLGIALGVATAISAAPAFAAITLPGGIGILEDDNIEYVTDANGDIKTSGTLAVGDVLHAVITFDSVLKPDNSTVQSLGEPGQELTGMSAIEVVAVGFDTISFGPNADFEDIYGIGAMAALYEQNPGDLNLACQSGGTAGCEVAATNGNHWMTVGFSDADDFWVAASGVPFGDISATDISEVADGAATEKFGVANYGLSILENNTGFEFNQQFSTVASLLPGGDDSLVDIVGSGDLLGGAGLTSPWVARSDFDFQLDRVPAPASLALMGLGIAGLGFARRMKKG